MDLGASACSIPWLAASRRPGPSPAAAVPTWGTSRPMGASYGSPAGTITRCTFSIPNTGASSIASRLVEIRMEGGVAAAGSVLTGAYRQHAVKQVLGVG
jgi:hypothetical protein